jgi:predicted double-glycine peptidase
MQRKGLVLVAASVATLLPEATLAEPVRSLLEMRQERTVVQEWDLSCGAAALATLLNYQHGDPVTEREIAIGLIGRDRYLQNPNLIRAQNGFSLLDLKRYVDERGYEGIGFGGLDFEDLDKYAPIMVPISRVGYDHFVIYRGRMGNRVLLSDPAFGTVTMTVRKFQRAWLDLGDLGRVGFIVAGRNGPVPPNALAPEAYEYVTLR